MVSIFRTEDGSSRSLPNVGTSLQKKNCEMLHPRAAQYYLQNLSCAKEFSMQQTYVNIQFMQVLLLKVYY
jgi:hypothetical protein